jgi:hypothetical protein
MLLLQKIKSWCEASIYENEKTFREVLLKGIAKILIQMNF